MNVMVIDDIKSSRVILEKIMNSIFVCNSITVASGKEALITLSSYTPDLILLDVSMPQMNGFEFLQILRRNHAWKNIPVVIISGKDEKSVLNDFASMEVSGYLFKPFSAQDVESVLTPLLRGAQDHITR
jgi:CheY-like chemotaxis protein